MSVSKRLLCASLLASACVAAQADPAPPMSNVALAGTASQSTTGYGGTAGLAIDGNTSGIFWDGSISHTADGDHAPWWMVALSGDHAIEVVTIHNRTDCCTDRLSDFTIELLDDGVTVASTAFAGVFPISGSFAFAGITADAVRISKRTQYLGLAEVQVYAVPTSPVPEPGGLLLASMGAVALTLLSRRRAAA